MAKYFLESHEWIEVDGDSATVGISAYAANELGDITYVELPEVDDEFEAGDTFGVVESVKAASDVYLPIAGTISEVNEALEEDPSIVNSSAEKDGWICKITGFNASALEVLLDEEKYAAFIAGL